MIKEIVFSVMIFAYCHHLRDNYISNLRKLSNFLGNFRVTYPHCGFRNLTVDGEGIIYYSFWSILTLTAGDKK